ncbi:MAG: hypothetical protein EZS28_005580, partial [Streblomastix strix]
MAQMELDSLRNTANEKLDVRTNVAAEEFKRRSHDRDSCQQRFELVNQLIEQRKEQSNKNRAEMDQVLQNERQVRDKCGSIQIRMDQYQEQLRASKEGEQDRALDILQDSKNNGQISGFYGRLGTLGKLVSDQFETAVVEATGGQKGALRNFVVQTKEDANRCIRILKDNKIAPERFSVLNVMQQQFEKERQESLSDQGLKIAVQSALDLKEKINNNKQQQKGSNRSNKNNEREQEQDYESEIPAHGLHLLTLIEPDDQQFLPAFGAALRNTLLGSQQNARELAVPRKQQNQQRGQQQYQQYSNYEQRRRVVTLSGMVIETSGAISGGGVNQRNQQQQNQQQRGRYGKGQQQQQQQNDQQGQKSGIGQSFSRIVITDEQRVQFNRDSEEMKKLSSELDEIIRRRERIESELRKDEGNIRGIGRGNQQGRKGQQQSNQSDQNLNEMGLSQLQSEQSGLKNEIKSITNELFRLETKMSQFEETIQKEKQEAIESGQKAKEEMEKTQKQLNEAKKSSNELIKIRDVLSKEVQQLQNKVDKTGGDDVTRLRSEIDSTSLLVDSLRKQKALQKTSAGQNEKRVQQLEQKLKKSREELQENQENIEEMTKKKEECEK